MAGDTYNLPVNSAAGNEGVAASASGVGAKDNAVALGGTGNKNNLGGEYNLGAGANLTIQGAAGVEAVAAKFTDALAQINDTSSLDRADQNKLVADSLAKVAALAESKQTDGISSLGKLALWGLAIIAVAVVFFKKFK